MENCDSASVSNNKVTTAPFDPGWNDPPSFAYSTQQTTPNRPRNFLNKRVAFPLTGGINATATPPPASLPSMPTALHPPIQNILPEVNQDNNEIDSESILQEVKDILLSVLESSSELGPKANSIKKRIATMEEMWLSGKLHKQIKLQMKELAYALKEDNPSRADDIHKALMVDHVSAVCTWMPGVKQLIHHCIARSELLAIDKE